MELKQSTALYVQVGPFLDVTDGSTPETALSFTAYISKAGGAFAARNSSTAISHDRDGFYRVHLDATDTNTTGILILEVTDSATHLPATYPFQVVSANYYDTKYGSDKFQVDVQEVAGSSVSGISDFKATGFSTFNAGTDTVTLSSGTHTGAVVPTVTNVSNASVSAMQNDALVDFLANDTGETSAVAGSVGLISQGSAGGAVTVGDIQAAALAKFLNTDTGETSAVSGSVGAISQGSAGGDVTVGDIRQAALAKFASTDTGETAVVAGSVCKLADSGSTAGSGAEDVTITITDNLSNPIDGVEVWITTDESGNNVIAGTLTTDAMGQADFKLDPGDYFIHAQKSGWNPTGFPQAYTVTAS